MTADWERARLGDFLRIKHGFAFKSKYFANEGDYIVLTPGNFLPKGGLLHKGDKEKYYSGDFSDDYILNKGDLLIVMTDLTQNAPILGAPAFIKEDNRYLHNQRLGLIQNLKQNRLDKSFLFYLMNFPEVRAQIKASSTGATVKHTAPDRIYKVEVNIPPLSIQRKIAGILSAYDYLIENNTRRINILEEMTQRIYREWFVHFRYPSQKNDKLAESDLGMIPEGWEVKTLEDALSALESGSRPRGGIDPNVREMPSIGAENVLGLGKYDYSKEKFVTREYYEGMSKGHIRSGDVLLYKDGAKLGRKSMFMNGFPHDECCINEHVFILRTNELCSQAYLYFWLDLPNVTQNIINLNSNAAQPGINRGDVKSLSILIANQEIRAKFDNIVYPILNEIFNLAKKNNKLRLIRDLLLPKFISNNIDVSQLDIDIGETDESLQ